METNFRLIHLQQFFKQLTLSQDAFRVRWNIVQIAEIFAVHSSKYKVTFFRVVGQKTQGSNQLWETFVWNDTAWRKYANYFFILIEANDRCVWFCFHEVKNLPISEKTLHALVNRFLKDEVFVIVAHLSDVSLNHIIESHLPVVDTVEESVKMIAFALSNICIQNAFVNLASNWCGHASFCILN